MENKRNVCVLCYHRINSLDRDMNRLAVSKSNFKQQLLWLKRNYEIIRFEEDWTGIDRDAAVLTFDDGYRDFYVNALPLLEELQIPATVFITTGSIAQNGFMWWDELEYLLFAGQVPEEFHLRDSEYEYVWDLSSYEDRVSCYRSLHFLMKNMVCVEVRQEWFRQLWEWKGEAQSAKREYAMLDAEEIRQLEKSPYVTIGAHTVSHPSLLALSEERRRFEIEQSVMALNSLLAHKISVFSYPFGRRDYDFNEYDEAICRSLGIEKTAATDMGLWRQGESNFSVKRNGVNMCDLFAFMEYIGKINNMYAR